MNAAEIPTLPPVLPVPRPRPLDKRDPGRKHTPPPVRRKKEQADVPRERDPDAPLSIDEYAEAPERGGTIQ